MSNLIHHAKTELKAAGFYKEESDYGGMIPEAILELIEVFSKQGHSGGSAGLVISLFQKLASFEPLVPLTGADDEWMEVTDGCFQNIRCGHVFKQKDRFDGQAYDINGRIFREPNGCCYTSAESFLPITFPYTPKTEYVDRPSEAA